MYNIYAIGLYYSFDDLFIIIMQSKDSSLSTTHQMYLDPLLPLISYKKDVSKVELAKLVMVEIHFPVSVIFY